MKKRRAIILIALITILSVINYVWAENKAITEEVLINGFELVNPEFLEVNSNSSGKITDKYIDAEELKKISKDIAEKLEIKKPDIDGNGNIIESENMLQLITQGKDKENRNITIILTTYIETYTDTEETDLVINITQSNKLEDIKNMNEKIKDIFSKYNVETRTFTCITGTYKGKLQSEQMDNTVTKILKEMNANKIEGLIQPNIISISAYSPFIDDYIYTGNNKMNLNIAMRYNEYEDKTYLWIATPIITIEY